MNNPTNPQFNNRRPRHYLTPVNSTQQPLVNDLPTRFATSAIGLEGQILWKADAIGTITELNPTWQTYTGMDPEVSLAGGFLQAIHLEDRPIWHRVLSSSETPTELTQKRLGVSVCEMELRLLGSDGIYRWMLVQALPLMGKKGEVVGWQGTFMDIDRLKQTQLQLQEKQEFLENLIASCSEAIIAGDTNGTIQIFNQAAQELYGLAEQNLPQSAFKSGPTGEQFPGTPDPSRSASGVSIGNSQKNLEAVDPSSTSPKTLPLWYALQTETPSEKELVLTPKTGKPRIMLANSHPIFNPGGMKLGAVTLMRDITKRKQRKKACFTLYAETQEEVRLLNAQLSQRDRKLPLNLPNSPQTTDPESLDDSETQRLPRIENEEDFANLFQTLDLISPYHIAGLLWDQSGELQGVMNCHRLLADSLWERLESLLLKAFPDQNLRSPSPEAVVWSIALPEGEGYEVPVTELGSLLLFPVVGKGDAQKVGLLFVVPEGRSVLNAYELGLLEGIIQQASETLEKLSSECWNYPTDGSGNTRCDRPKPSLQNRANLVTGAEKTDRHSQSNRDRSSAAAASQQPTREKPGDRPESVSSFLSHPFKEIDVSPSQNRMGKSQLLDGSDKISLNQNRKPTPDNCSQSVSQPFGASPSPQNSPDPEENPTQQNLRVQKNYPGRDREPLYDSIDYRTEMEGGSEQGKRSEPAFSEGPGDPQGSDTTPGDEGVLIYDADGILTTCNPSAERILGLSVRELIGRSYQDAGYSSIFLDGSPVEGDRHPVAITFNTGEPQSNTIVGICQPDDTLTWVSLKLQPLFDSDCDQEGRYPCTVIVYLQEIDNFTEDQDYPRELNDPNYQFMVEQSQDLIARHSPEGLYLYASSASRSLLEYEPEELVGQSIYGFVHPEDVTAVNRIFTDITRESPTDPVIYRHRRKDGAYIWLETTLGSAHNPGLGRESEAIAVSRDITPRKDKEEKVNLLNHDLERLVRKQRLELDNARQLKDELLLREQLARKVAEAAKTLLSKERQRIAESRSFLAEATTLLTASLDYQTTLENLARLLVPRFADWCAINVMENGTRPIGSSDADYHCVTVACLDPSKQSTVWALQNRYPVNGGGRYSYWQQLMEIRRSQSRSDWGERQNGAEFCLGITDDELAAVAEDQEHLELLRSLDCQADLWLPICFGDRTFGSILLMRGNQPSSRRLRLEGDAAYSQSELSLVEDLVRRGAMTLEKAILYREARETGENLRKTVCILGERQRQLRTLQQLANLLNQRIADLPRLLQLMVEAVCEAIPKAQFCLIVLHDRQLDRLELMATAGTGTQNLPIGIPLKTKDSLLSEVFATGQSLLRCHSLNGLTTDSETKILPGELPACVYAVPIESARAGRLGVLAVGNWEDLVAFEVEDLRQMVTAVGEQAAIAINNARSIEILEERDQLLQTQNHTLACQNQELEAKRQQIERQNCQLREASRLKSEFLATMSHELRTPMNSILGFSQVLLRGRRHPLASQQKQMVERILNNGKQLLTLIDDILDLSKIEAGHSELKLEEFEVDLLVSATCEELRIFAQHKNLTLQFDSTLDNSRVVGDHLRLRQMVTNLISNAIKFTTSGGVVVSVFNPSPDWVEILVKDTGIGIPPEQLNDIFEAFRQGDQTTTREYSGTGLGLALCESLVRLMKGTISVESQLNEGSTFSIQIPRSISELD
ncbi:PAS domain S-box protein [Phormidium pseudopriestleyi FRX01]|uniref:histidine kinase n=1 Tax=Phormidium pseudopriestleyi FRX01 TaxID=1759528 RepID=A0ABS3FVC5_9CYAN|nr:PAS domain S-box protein [Phormidium pseudopriestleyi]MBO0351067.1 PAS domain S-box protein [Phormidium pseudopriestleyi FRX01]